MLHWQSMPTVTSRRTRRPQTVLLRRYCYADAPSRCIGRLSKRTCTHSELKVLTNHLSPGRQGDSARRMSLIEQARTRAALAAPARMKRVNEELAQNHEDGPYLTLSSANTFFNTPPVWSSASRNADAFW